MSVPAPPQADPVADSSVGPGLAFIERLFPSPRNFALRLWNGQIVPAAGRPLFTLAIRDHGSLRRMFRPPVELALGEAYLRREFDIEGDLPGAFEIIHSARETLSSPRAVLAVARAWRALPATEGGAAGMVSLRPPARLSGAVGSQERDRAAVRHHYDVGNDFYQLFLDERMVYSCAYFETGDEDLDVAQQAKLDLLCRKLRLVRGDHLLDIGCGWGGLLIHAARAYGVTGVGVTLSEEQYTLARARVAAAGLDERVRIELRDYRELGAESFDKIASVGMFEHVVESAVPGYFATVFRLLRQKGLFLNHAIASRPGTYRGVTVRAAARLLDRFLVGNLAFRTRYVFPDGELRPVSEANMVAERAGFELRDVENLREHYALTLRHWLERLRSNREQALALVGEPMYRLWEMYLAGSAYHFETARITVNQSLLAKAAVGATTSLPRTRTELYTEPLVGR